MNYISHKFPGITINHSLDTTPIPKVFKMHTHPQFEIFCFLRGKGKYHIEGSEYDLHTGDILIMRPGEAHFFEPDSRYPYERITFHINTDYFAQIDPQRNLLRPVFDRNAGKQNLYHAADFHNGNYMHYIQSMVQQSVDPLSCLANLILLLQELGKVFDRNPMSSDPTNMESRLIGYINHNLSKPLSLQHLCEAFYLSRAELCRRFKKATGTSVGKYINIKRLLNARQLILQGKKPTEVYHTCGYQDYSTFYRAYVQYFGCCPRDDHQALPLTDRYEII